MFAIIGFVGVFWWTVFCFGCGLPDLPPVGLMLGMFEEPAEVVATTTTTTNTTTTTTIIDKWCCIIDNNTSTDANSSSSDNANANANANAKANAKANANVNGNTNVNESACHADVPHSVGKSIPHRVGDTMRRAFGSASRVAVEELMRSSQCSDHSATDRLVKCFGIRFAITRVKLLDVVRTCEAELSDITHGVWGALELECVRFADLVMAWVNEAASSAADFMFSVLSLFDRFLLFSRSVRSELEACFLSFFAGPIGAYRSVEADLKSASEVIRGGFGKVVACTEIADQSVKLFCINHRIDQSKKHLERIFRGWKVEAAAVVNKVDIKYLFEAVAALSDACSFLLWIVLLLVLLSFEIVNFLGLFAGMSSGEKRKFRLAQQLFAACVFHVCCR